LLTATPTRVDPHVKRCSPEIVERARRAGLDALVYAPHFTQLPEIERRAASYSRPDCLVVPGRELFTGSWRERKHVLALGLEEPIPDFISLAAAMDALDEQDATVIAPHPEFLTVSLTEADLREYRDVIDAVEVYNPKYRSHHSRRARELARELDLPAIGSSYAHLPMTIGDVWTAFDRVLTTETGLRDAIETPGAGDRCVCRRSGAGPWLRSTAEFCHLGWENSWTKFDRVVRSDREPTHPADPLYEGRFDDSVVYADQETVPVPALNALSR
jgi:predicted metal-dependent phosphoesterase TrpH